MHLKKVSTSKKEEEKGNSLEDYLFDHYTLVYHLYLYVSRGFIMVSDTLYTYLKRPRSLKATIHFISINIDSFRFISIFCLPLTILHA